MASAFPPATAHAGDAELLTEVRAAHRAARESIRTITADIKIEFVVPEKKLVQQGTYQRKLDAVRAQARHPAGTSDYLVANSELRQLNLGPKLPSGKHEGYARRAPKSDGVGLVDVWEQMLINFSHTDGRSYDYGRFLEQAKQPPQVRRERSAGVPCVRVSMVTDVPGYGDFGYVLWHDMSRNYLVRKFELIYLDKANRFEAENVEFAEPEPGVFVPTRCVRRRHWGERYTESVTSLSNVVVNQPIPDTVFRLPPVPSGTELHDEVRGTQYPINSQWVGVGPEKPLVKLSVVMPSGAETSEYQSQSEDEPRRAYWWLLPAALLVLAAAVGVRLYRRYRRDPDE